MVENVILDVCNFLKSKNILIPSQNQWLRGCITCFRENTQHFSSLELKEFVFDQWKLADLKDICAPSLPNNCKTALKLTLPGKYAVQVNYVVNIGESHYKQLQKIRRPTAEENLSVDTEKDKTSTEPAANRTLKLEITDGIVTLLGFEDKPIRKLVEPFVPGVKAILSGPIECRKGVLFLKNENISILGGEVDTLHIPNALENILARALGQSENPDPYKSLIGASGVDHQENVLEDDADAFLQVADEIENSYLTTASGTSHTSSFANNTTSSISLTESRKTTSSNFSQSINRPNHVTSNEFNSTRGINADDSSCNSNRSTLNRLELNPISNRNVKLAEFKQSSGMQHKTLNSTVIELDDEDDEVFALVAAETASVAEQTVKISKPSNPKQSSIHNFFSNKNNSSSSSNSHHIERDKSPKRRPTTNYIKKNEPTENIDKYTSKNSSDVKNYERNLCEDLRAQLEESYSDFMSPENQIAQDTSKNSSNHKRGKEKESRDLFKEFNIIEEDLANKKNKKSNEIITFPPKKYPCTQIVRGCVQQLSQKLSIQENKWSLSAMVKMKGVEMEVDFSSEALDAVFGITATELQAKRQEVKRNPELKEKINQTLKLSQRRIQKLDCDMKVHFTNYIAKPLILEIID